MVAEMLNTAIERLCNLINPSFSEEVRVIKDICAAAVLISGLALVVVGIWIIAVS
jgi:diacylglycerol kinase